MDALDVPVSRDHSINATARLTLTYALRHSNRYDTHHRASCPRTSIARRSSLPLLFLENLCLQKETCIYKERWFLLTRVQNGVAWIGGVDGQHISHPRYDRRRRTDGRAQQHRVMAHLDHLGRWRLRY